jgi:serine protease AprX
MRAIGVGECCITTPDVAYVSGAWGSTPDGRIKPDVAGPTGIWTAAALADGNFRSFPGTSGALPLVAGAARLLKDWMAREGRLVTPGNVYAMILMCGQRGMVDTREGVGPIHLPGAGTIWWGPPMTIGAGDSLTVDFDAPDGTVSQLDVAIWWPEYDTSASGFPAVDKRGWVSLQAIDPDGRWATPGEIQGSVLQRVSLRRDSNMAPGTWKMSVSGRYMPEGESRQVYWAAWARP